MLYVSSMELIDLGDESLRQLGEQTSENGMKSWEVCNFTFQYNFMRM